MATLKDSVTMLLDAPVSPTMNLKPWICNTYYHFASFFLKLEIIGNARNYRQDIHLIYSDGYAFGAAYGTFIIHIKEIGVVAVVNIVNREGPASLPFMRLAVLWGVGGGYIKAVIGRLAVSIDLAELLHDLPVNNIIGGR